MGFWALLKFEMRFHRNRRWTLLPESIHILTFRYLHGLPTEIYVVITNSADNFSVELATWGCNSFSPPHCFPGSLRTRGACLSRASQGGRLPLSIADLTTRGGLIPFFSHWIQSTSGENSCPRVLRKAWGRSSPYFPIAAPAPLCPLFLLAHPLCRSGGGLPKTARGV